MFCFLLDIQTYKSELFYEIVLSTIYIGANGAFTLIR